MFKITVNTTRSAMFCLASACLASSAHAELTTTGGVPVAVSDALLATTHAANLQRGLVGNLGGVAPATVAPVNATQTVANNVRLWDEVIPPAPSPKPTQASLTLPSQPRTAAVSPTPVQVGTAASLQTTSLRVSNVNNAATARMHAGFAR
ncbi:hypothetical protein [Pandoraea pulmonicola]|nr:hypothetical protein [Pandoraea pulmonicola]